MIKSGDIIDATKKLINEPEFAERLDRAGGFVALVGIGITIYNDIKDSLKTDEQKAFGALLKVVFESANETLDEANRKYLKGAELALRCSLLFMSCSCWFSSQNF